MSESTRAPRLALLGGGVLLASAAATPCTEDGGQVCDGTGNCVECTVDGDCPGTDICSAHACMPATCDDGTLNALETDVDCGGPDCPPCATGSTCFCT